MNTATAESNDEIILPATIKNVCGLESMRIKYLTTQDPLEEKIATLNESVTYYLLKSCVVYSKYTKDQTNKPIELPQTYSYLKFILLNKAEQSNNETAVNTSATTLIENNIRTVRTNTDSIDYGNTTTEQVTIIIPNTTDTTMKSVSSKINSTKELQGSNNVDTEVTKRNHLYHVEEVSHGEHKKNGPEGTTDGFKPTHDTSDGTDDKIKDMTMPIQGRYPFPPKVYLSIFHQYPFPPKVYLSLSTNIRFYQIKLKN